jgi:O-antigen ligase
MSVLDVALAISCGIVLVWSALDSTVALGPTPGLLLLIVAPLVAASSMMWTQDIPSTAVATLIAVEAVLAYVVGISIAVRVGLKTTAKGVGIFVVVCLSTSLLFYLQVPGFNLYVPPKGAPSVARLVSAYTRLSHPFIGLSNDYAPLLGTAGLLLAGYSRALRSRTLGVVSVLASVGMLLTLSRGVVAAFVIGGGAYLVLVRARGRQIMRIAATVALVVIAGWLTLAHIEVRVGGRTVLGLDIVADRSSNMTNLSARADRLRETLDQASDRPWVGAGAGVLDPARTGALADASHNTVLEQLLFFGGVLGTFVAFAWVAFPAALWAALPPMPSHPERAGLLASAIFLVLASTTQTFLEASTPRVIVHLLLGFGVGTSLARTTRRVR